MNIIIIIILYNIYIYICMYRILLYIVYISVYVLAYTYKSVQAQLRPIYSTVYIIGTSATITLQDTECQYAFYYLVLFIYYLEK